MMEAHDSMEEFRIYVVLCGKSHISVNDVHKFTLEEATQVRNNMEAKILEKIEATDERDLKSIGMLEWRLATLRIEEIVLN
jgi:hypothetical protein